MASVGLADAYSNVRDMDGRDDVYEFFAQWSRWKPNFLGHYAVPHLYEPLDSP